ncbi:uncharacterized protein BX663DRAFT_525571 [Cokeromyces recurvatus]|uniref:uncharacterized protein n=1 Tax=Cokeromyces recurvatus TaxID=90255 RepID=UPI0022206353|nr:uncharacterized protein BX663DRAFT_525571 [Cokeromyces recurvatus]KAI7898207.1 hypothetical protein BX663DRAFT_525571 [Cokeromyces recurvatus]
MASKLDQALDDVIRERKRERTHNKRHTNFSSSRRGPIRKRSNNNGPTTRSFIRTIEVDNKKGIDGQWAHDMFDEDTLDRRADIFSRLGTTKNRSPRGIEISIDNLHYNVTEKDVEELFSTIGKVLRARLFYDPSGRSTGSAVVKYETQQDAEKAIEKYNNVELDGQPMRIQLREYTPRNKPREGGSRRYESNRGSRGRRHYQDNRNRRTTREAKTSEELDKEMESYMKSNDDNTDAMMLD